MSAQFDRQCSLILGDVTGNGIELSSLHVKFTVHQADVSTPAYADIRIYNVAPTTARRLETEFTNVFLSAGYPGNIGLIFSGKVRQYRRGRESNVDTYLDILAQDGDEAYNFAVANTTLSAGWTQKDLHGRLVDSMGGFGVTAGYVPEFNALPAPRAKVLYGMTRDYLTQLGDAANTSWHITDNLINMVPRDIALPGEAVVLTSNTGMVGLPQQTINGVTVRSLLNPKLRFGTAVQLDNASIQLAQDSVAYSAINYFPSTDADGVYKIYANTMTGDTRSGPWYSDLICVALNGSAPLQGPYINATASSTGF